MTWRCLFKDNPSIPIICSDDKKLKMIKVSWNLINVCSFFIHVKSCCLEALVLTGYNLSMDVVKENTSKIDAESQKPMRLPQWLKQNKNQGKGNEKVVPMAGEGSS